MTGREGEGRGGKGREGKGKERKGREGQVDSDEVFWFFIIHH